MRVNKTATPSWIASTSTRQSKKYVSLRAKVTSAIKEVMLRTYIQENHEDAIASRRGKWSLDEYRNTVSALEVCKDDRKAFKNTSRTASNSLGTKLQRY